MEKKRTGGKKKPNKERILLLSHSLWPYAGLHWSHSQPPPLVIKALVIKRAGRDMFLK